MSIQQRIVLFLFASLFGTLVILTAMVGLLFSRISTDAEVRLLWNRAQIVLRKPEVRQPDNWGAELLDEFLVEGSMLRILDQTGAIRAAAWNDSRLTEYPPVYRTAYDSEIISHGSWKRLYIHVPILQLPSKKQVGLLELGKSLDLMEGYSASLFQTLIWTTCSGAIVSILIALLLARQIRKPVTRLAVTMERIEGSGRFQKLEEELTGSGDEFARLGATFNRMIGKLEDNYLRQMRFVQEASHELRTPLTVIRSYADLLKRWGHTDPSLRQEAAESILAESDRLLQLVQTFLHRADQGEHLVQASFYKVELEALLGKLVQELVLSSRRQILLQSEVTSRDSILEANPDKLKQLFIILIDNAIQYSDKKITVRLKGGRDGIQVLVIDQGIGIPREHLRKLFQRFYRSEEAKRRNAGGSGLGLPIAEQLVKEHGGSLEITSTPGKGTVVWVQLPRTQTSRLRGETAEGVYDSIP